MTVAPRRPQRRTRTVIAGAVVTPVLLCGCAASLPADGPGAADGPAPVSGASTSASPASSSTTPSPKSASTSPARPDAAARGRSCVTRTLARLSPSARAAQLLLVGVDATAPTSAGNGLARLGVAGVFLRGRVAGSSALARQVAAVQTTARRAGSLRLLVAADEEGGFVQTVRGGTIPPFATALVQGGWSTRTLRRRTTTWATSLAKLGVNLDLAPVADVVPASLGTRNPPIGRYQREYGHTPAAVSRPVATVVEALRSAKVGATVKHFPGLGRVLVNTDTGKGATDAAMTATDPYLQTFVAGTKAGALAVMVSSASYPKLDRRHLAMWSSAIVTDLLRTRLGWTGLVVSDDLGQAVAASVLPVGRRAVDFVAAGGDLVLTVQPSQATTMRDAIAARARTDTAFRARVDDAARHVLGAKQTLGLLSCG